MRVVANEQHRALEAFNRRRHRWQVPEVDVVRWLVEYQDRRPL
jgi:hypothetical protein